MPASRRLRRQSEATAAPNGDEPARPQTLTEFAAQFDWDKMFARLRIWPLNCTDYDIGEQTPRKTFELWWSLNDFFGAVKAIGEGSEEAAADPRTLPEAGSPPRRPTEPARGSEKPVGVAPNYPLGLNLESYKCWKPVTGEDADQEFGGDPFTVPRNVAKDRYYATILEGAKFGMLEKYGIAKDNPEAVRDFVEQTWAENSKTFEIIRRVAFDPDIDEENGKAVLTKLDVKLKAYALNLTRDMTLAEFVSDFYQHLKKCADKRRTDELRRESSQAD